VKNNLKKLRDRIDAIDEKILTYLNSRAKIAYRIARCKKGRALSVYSPEREEGPWWKRRLSIAWSPTSTTGHLERSIRRGSR